MPARPCALVLVLLAGCGDRSPPALWPEPPPPTLAKPIGIDEPVREGAGVGQAETPAEVGATDGAAPTTADAPSEPKPPERLPMPPLTP